MPTIDKSAFFLNSPFSRQNTTMGEEHVGSMVSVDCGSVLGVYEGCVLQVDSLLHTLTLKDPKRNGVVYPVAKVTLRLVLCFFNLLCVNFNKV